MLCRVYYLGWCVLGLLGECVVGGCDWLVVLVVGGYGYFCGLVCVSVFVRVCCI